MRVGHGSYAAAARGPLRCPIPTVVTGGAASDAGRMGEAADWPFRLPSWDENATRGK